MATASDLAVLHGLSTYKARAEAKLGHAYSLYGGHPAKLQDLRPSPSFKKSSVALLQLSDKAKWPSTTTQSNNHELLTGLG